MPENKSHNLIERILNAGSSALMFGCGTAALYMADLLLVANLEDGELANWAFLKSMVFIGGGFVVFGMDHAVLRAKIDAWKFLPWHALQVSLLSLPFFGLTFLAQVELNGWATWVSIASLGVILGVGGYLRSQFRIFESLVFLQGWRILFLGILLSMLFFELPLTLETGLSLALSVWGLGALTYALLRDRAIKTSDARNVSFPQLYPISARFWGLALLANGMTYLDQIILNLDGQQAASARYYTYTSIFLPLIVLATGFLANTVNPYLRKQGDHLRKKIPFIVKIFIGGGAALLCISIVVGIGIGIYIGRFESINDIEMELLACVMAIALLRYVYLFPSAVLGVFGTKGELDRWLVVGGISIGAMLFTYFAVRAVGSTALMSIAIAMIINLGLRVAYGSVIATRILNSGRPLEVSV